MGLARRLGVLVCSSVLAWSLAGPGATVHMSPGGRDGASGGKDSPIRTLARLQAVLIERPDVTEVVFGPGVYRGYLQVLPPKNVPKADAHKLPRLVLRPAHGAEAVIDGAATVKGAEPLTGETTVYQAPLGRRPGQKGHLSFQVWEEDTWQRYHKVADIAAVRRFPASVTFREGKMFFHTSDGAPPDRHRVRMLAPDVSKYGLFLRRPNVTAKGLTVRNFKKGCIGLGGAKALVLDCRVSNAAMGVAIGGAGVVVRGCLVEDCGTGVYVNGKDTTVENCRIFKRQSSFTMARPVQEDTGIEVYSPAGGNVVVRGNVVKGFRDFGLLFKCKPGKFLVENNVFVENTTGVLIVQQTPCEAMVRNCVFYNCKRATSPRSFRGFDRRFARNNCVWALPWKADPPLDEQLKYFNESGSGSFISAPVFVDPSARDYRQSSRSPCVGRGSGGGNVGLAETVSSENAPDRVAPALSLAKQPSLGAVRAPDGGTTYVCRTAVFPIRLHARDPGGAVKSTRIRFGDGPWGPATPFAETLQVRMPGGKRRAVLSVQVADAAGNWSEPGSLRLQLQEGAPRAVGGVTVRANSRGVAISFRTPYPCSASGAYSLQSDKLDRPLRSAGGGVDDGALLADRHVLFAVLDKAADATAPGFYKIELKGLGGVTGALEGTFRLGGSPAVYHVATNGEDKETNGPRGRPWRSLQYAADRALPGDRIVIAPGLYTEATVMRRGGAAGAPITIVAAERWRAVFDGHRRHNKLIALYNAPHVVFDGLQARWIPATYSWAFYLKDSPHVTVRNCRIWNSFWTKQRLDGVGIGATDSPHLRVENNLLHGLDFFAILLRSPHGLFRHNTMHGAVHGGIRLLFSAEGTSIRNNSLAYAGSVTYRIAAKDLKELATFDSDYNNFANRLRPSVWRNEPGVAPNMPRPEPTMGYGGSARGIVAFGLFQKGRWQTRKGQAPRWAPDPKVKAKYQDLRVHTIEDWRRFSGKDSHSLFVAPKYRDLLSFDFRLQPDSPNIGAGENGANIGAMAPFGGPERAKPTLRQ